MGSQTDIFSGLAIKTDSPIKTAHFLSVVWSFLADFHGILNFSLFIGKKEIQRRQFKGDNNLCRQGILNDLTQF